jgi:hypothetical protein
MIHSGIPAAVGAAALAHGYRHIHDKHRPPDELVFLANEASTPVDAPKRKAPRLPCAILVGFRRPGDRWEYGLSHYLSVAGMFLRTIDPPAAGTTLELEFTPPGGVENLTPRAEVAWSKDFSQRTRRTAPTGMGIKFIDPDPAVEQAMSQAMKLLASEGAHPS